ncbi:hypothetical protein D1872_305910 [compost metagenome]
MGAKRFEDRRFKEVGIECLALGKFGISVFEVEHLRISEAQIVVKHGIPWIFFHCIFKDRRRLVEAMGE